MEHGREKAAAAAAAAAATFKRLLLAISVTITPHQSEALFGADDEDKAWVYLSNLCLFLYNLIECGVCHGTHPLT